MHASKWQVAAIFGPTKDLPRYDAAERASLLELNKLLEEREGLGCFGDACAVMARSRPLRSPHASPEVLRRLPTFPLCSQQAAG